MDPGSLLAAIGGGFLGKLDHATLFISAIIVVIWWVYKEAVWSRIRP